MTYVNGDILTMKTFSKVPALGPNIAAVDRPPLLAVQVRPLLKPIIASSNAMSLVL